MKLSRIIGVTALVLMATASPALAARHRPDHMVPFEGSVLALDNGQIMPAPAECPEWAQWQFFSNGTGSMSHLGRSDLSLVQCSRYVVPPLVGASEGTTTFTAANGDELVLVHSLGFEVTVNWLPGPEGPIPVPDGFEGAGTWIVLEGAGSGRFADASGSGTVAVYGDVPTDDTPMYDLPAGATMWAFSGMISYDASDRAQR